jgi:hypothetical protein
MNSLSAILFIVFHFNIGGHKNASSQEVLQSMYSRYHSIWHKSLKFNQTTERYRNDSLITTNTWYETIVYPDL